jgi:hypothetical protein
MVSSSITVSYPETQVDDSDIFIPPEKQVYDRQGKEVFAGRDNYIKLTLMDIVKKQGYEKSFLAFSLDENWVLGQL